MQRVIITADDYGMCDIVDKAIDAGIENGFVTTTNVMLNMESLENAKTLRNRYPTVSVGIHWNVTTGYPISNPKDIPSLIREDGSFWPLAEFKKRYSQKKINPQELEKELDAQAILFENICGAPDYWNTHENSALHTKAFCVFAKVAKMHGIVATRTFQRVYYDKINLGVKKTLRELLVRNFFEYWFSKIRKEFVMPTARVVSFGKISKTKENILLDAILKDGRDNIEVVFHPAISTEYQYFGNISTERVKEYEFVSSKSTKSIYLNSGIQFVSFSDLQ